MTDETHERPLAKAVARADGVIRKQTAEAERERAIEAAIERVKLAGVVAPDHAIRFWVESVSAGTVLESSFADIKEVCVAF